MIENVTNRPPHPPPSSSSSSSSSSSVYMQSEHSLWLHCWADKAECSPFQRASVSPGRHMGSAGGAVGGLLKGKITRTFDVILDTSAC